MKINNSASQINTARTILINGIGWIGKAIFNKLYNQNHQLIIVDKSQQALNNALENTDSEKVMSICMDLSDEKSVLDLTNLISVKFKSLDAVIHTAAIYPRAMISDISYEEWMQVINSNLTSAFLAIKHTSHLMRANKWGRVLLFSSTTGVDFGVSGFTHYATTKAGIEGLVKASAIELAPFGITVNALCLGNIINEPLYKITAQEEQAMKSGIPVSRIGNPTDVTRWVEFLLDPGADFITGQSFRIDGGETLMPKADFVDLKQN